MAEYAFDGNVALVWCPGEDGIADKTAPSTSEISAGTDISTYLPKDGWAPNGNQNTVEGGKLAELYDSTSNGTWSATPTVALFRNNTADTAWELFERNELGFFVIRYGLPYDTAFANGQQVEVWEVQAGQKIMENTATNTKARFTLGFATPSEPEIDAIVGGGS